MIYAFILTALAGLATLLGIIPIFVKFKNINNIIAITCSFASGVMICISIFDLIPEGINYLSAKFSAFLTIIIAFLFTFLGIVISMLLEKIVDSHHAENKLYNVGILAMIVIILHNIPEGIVTFFVSSENIILGIPICIAIMLHNIPEGISIAIPIFYGTKSKFRAILYTLISALSELLGAFITYLFLKDFINDTILGVMFSFIAGVMITISFDKLIPTAKTYNWKLAYLSMIIGFIIMLFSLRLSSVIS